ncbi:Alpha/beta hydrolase fold protein OS=Tsukamurella paurometabola (strain ATCC 8368 / DSM / CCUG 35730 / CIP 100753 / JCM 10117 / KCTC 9821 / NBRC 16120 /NCIMB 702349 / NCTC 13040) OX=521096 GN=Tpau_3679 PE=4 SV=1 [Tsukamurella paurometabola]|uniref:Alpha/beta hydrolase fold protein n=1 Tax=Tsukamurella paurometabola (strain ATCC 8368 / DSM 20162 / CCUG 35730 / CIP 100753 / JCM 10117 / KCTC 9821 / NBRC 16120 / NCIMB 702349 / NCTC 13040) TaxID=521096 RepID=D5UY20_TSUPD|nr:alpha/beta fold hydrolase [Tsukamurella paurometabola]ADG80257.1 alpha/beta hydrolase fold protein [Tsukamurella paurometabola DSM 20162]SUP39035.1 Predicted hydrolase of the alpha/beta-hydrolase fold [Tsukamurella paurometabola]
MTSPARRPTVATLTYRDGATNPVRIFRGPDPAAPCLMIWPGVNVPAGYFDDLGRALVDAGYNAVVSELRGQGDSRPRGATGAHGFQDVVVEDYPAVSALVKQKFPDAKRILLGHSLGGLMGTMYAARARRNLAGVILIACGTGYYKLDGLSGAARRIGTSVAARAAARRGHWSGPDGLGEVPKGIVRDFDHLVQTGDFNVDGADVDYEARLAGTRTPVLTLAVAGDELVSDRQSRYVGEKFPAESVTHERIPDRLGHNQWIVEPDKVVPVLDRWIRALA